VNGAAVIILICSATLPRWDCTPETARVFMSLRVETPICGEGIFAAMASNPAGPKADEYLVIKCRM